METKRFKAFDKVIVKRDWCPEWMCDIYSHYNENSERSYHTTLTLREVKDDNILPYEGNEELVGTDHNPDEEIFINYGTELMAMTKNKNWIYATLDSIHCRDDYFTVELSNGEDIRVDEICRFSDFNPNDMEETRKHILVVKNGKVVKYKG